MSNLKKLMKFLKIRQIVDNLENDLKIFAANPDLAQKALEVAELAEKRYAAAGVEQPELKALAVGKTFVEEFQK